MSPAAATAPHPADVLDALVADQRTADEAARAAYNELARTIALDEGQPSPDEIKAVLSAAGETAESFRRVVQALRDRKRLVDTLNETAAAEARMVELDEAIAVIERRMEAERQAGIDEARPLHWERQQLAEKQRQGFTAEQELRRSVADKSLIASMQQARSRVAAAEQKFKPLEVDRIERGNAFKHHAAWQAASQELADATAECNRLARLALLP